MLFSVGNVSICREIPVVIQKEVKLDKPFGPAERGSGKRRQAQRNGGTVERQQLVFKSKFRFSGAAILNTFRV
jgi:hypothetical protein